MKNIIKLTTLGLAMLFAAFTANAQTPYQTTGNSEGSAGTTSLSVTVADSGDLRSGGTVSGTNGATGSGGSNNNELDATLIFDNVSPSQSAVNPTLGSRRFMRASVPILLRSNASYTVKAYLVGGANGIPAGAGNSGDFKTGDIGFGVRTEGPSVAPACTPGSAGCLVTSNAIVNVVPNSDPASVTVTNGQPAYVLNRTLNYVGSNSGTAATIVQGERISVRGDNTSANWRKAILLFAIKPQYYTPATFTDTLKVYIAVP